MTTLENSSFSFFALNFITNAVFDRLLDLIMLDCSLVCSSRSMVQMKAVENN